MGKFYRNYLSRLEKEQEDLPFRRSADLTARQLAPKFEETKGRVEDMLRRDNASPMAKAKFALAEEGQVIDQLGNIYTEAQVRDIARKDEMSGKIEETRFKADQEKEAERKADKSRTAQTWKSAAEILGFVGGTALSGGNVGIGLQAGKALGGVSDVVTGLDETYDSPESIVQGGASIISGVMTGLDTISQENFMSSTNELLPMYSKLSTEDKQLYMLEWQQALGGNNKARQEFLAKWGA